MLGVLAILAVIGITAYLIFSIQEEKEYEDVCRQMETALKSRQYKTVLDQYEHLSKSRPKLAQRPAILKFRDDAKEAGAMLTRLASDYNMALKAAAVFLTPEGVEDRRLAEHIQTAENLKSRIPVTAEQSAVCFSIIPRLH